jgi:nicotinamidase-related amidase
MKQGDLLNAIDPKGAVVLALHFQNDIAHETGKMGFGTGAKRANVVSAAQQLVAAARATEIPVVHVRVAYRHDYADTFRNNRLFERVIDERALGEGEWGSAFIDDMQPDPSEYIVTHRRVNPFYGSMLQEILDRLDAKTVVICGVATNYVVEHAARHASDVGYRTIVASDACSSSSIEAHDASLRSMELIAEVAPAAVVEGAFRSQVTA